MINILENADPVIFGERLRIARTKGVYSTYRRQRINFIGTHVPFFPLKRDSDAFERMSLGYVQKYMAFL